MIRKNAIYARQSVDRADSISIESQIEYCKYETRGEPCRIYQDKGYSGKNTDRPEFQEMLAAIRKGEIKRVICYKLDRCSRSILDFANLIDELQRYHVEFVSCTEKFDTASPMGRAMLNICIVFAQLERETIQQRVADAYHVRSQRGFYMGGRIPYACKLEPYIIHGKKTSRYAICQEEADVLYQIYLLYSHPQTSVMDIVDYLHGNGIKNTRTKDGKWTRSYLASVIKNPIYVKADIDVYQFFKDQGANIQNPPEDFVGTNGCYLFTDNTEKRKELGLERHNVVIAPHAGFIPSDLWLKCRCKCLNNKQVAKPVKAKNTWLAGKIKCPRCGYALVIKKCREKRYYMCSRHLCDRKSCDGVGALHARDVEEIILDSIRKKAADLGSLSSQIVQYEIPRINTLKIRITQLQNEIDAYLSRIAESNSTVIGYLNAKIAELDEKKKAYTRELKQLEDHQPSRELELHEVKDCMVKWNQLENRDKLAIVDAFIISLTASKEKISILWKL